VTWPEFLKAPRAPIVIAVSPWHGIAPGAAAAVPGAKKISLRKPMSLPASRNPPRKHFRSAPIAAGRLWRAPIDPQAPVLGRIGNLETRLARCSSEIRAAQALRYDVFYREMAARPDALALLTRRDRDRFDRACEHLLVIDRDAAVGGMPAADGPGRIVGTYRFLTARDAARAGLGFYSQREFDVDALAARHPGLHFMELGRSCVLAPWRNRRTIELLWAGIWAHVLARGVDVMVGCASFAGTDARQLAEPLACLTRHSPPPEWEARAREGVEIARCRDGGGMRDGKQALRGLPPLIKGYLRLGAWFAREAVVDRQFGTTDVLVILPVSRLNPRYVSYYGADASRHAVPAATAQPAL